MSFFPSFLEHYKDTDGACQHEHADDEARHEGPLGPTAITACLHRGREGDGAVKRVVQHGKGHLLDARGAACVVAEAYASSFPLTALQLVDPPISMQRATQRYPSLFPSALPEFTFEAQFPVRVAWTQPELAWHAEHGVPWYEVHRIEHEREDAAGECLDRYEWASFDEGLDDTIRWLEDEAGL